jgi:hypothetical protein
MKEETASNREEKDKTAGLAGAAGMCAGAQIGMLVLPVPFVGTFAGAFVGGIVGREIGRAVSPVLAGKFNYSRFYRKSGSVISQELERLAVLHLQGEIDEEEFRAAKARVLGLPLLAKEAIDEQAVT